MSSIKGEFNSAFFVDLLRGNPYDFSQPLAIFDAYDLGSSLPHAVLCYQMEAYHSEFQQEGFANGPEPVDESFATAELQQVVKSIYMLDEIVCQVDELADEETLFKHISTVLESRLGLVRVQTLLSKLIWKKEFQGALLVVTDPQSASRAQAENQLEAFTTSSTRVFIQLKKVTEAFDFLASIESFKECEEQSGSSAYKNSIALLIEYILTLSKQEIERKFLT